ncbi:MAG: methyltransferase domain-containing protein [Gammaproteobacteria bacterium]|nr:MAG: methyltransferase domain-containing protein [Gammaproteobacteria bacterium]UTW43470.1 methyltransferase domain-containing protein [bacterium SCSIO 12844]
MQQVNLNEVKKSFNRAAITYSNHNSIQQLALEYLTRELLNARSNFSVVSDFACGVGLSTQYLYDHILPDECYAIDIADCALKLASKHLCSYQVKFIEADYNKSILTDGLLDLAFCNMGFQWSSDFALTLKTMHYQLSDKGILAFSIPLLGTFSYLNQCNSLSFLALKVVLEMLKSAGFSILSYEQFYKLYSFNTPLAALQTLKGIGANISQKKTISGLMTLKSLNDYFKYANQYILDYRIGLFIARK